MTLISDSTAWKKLCKHHQQIADIHLRDLFDQQDSRGQLFSCESENIFVDYSKNRLTENTVELLFDLARTAELETWRERLFSGEIVNQSSQSPALHPILRDHSRDVKGVEDIKVSQQRMLELAEAIRSGKRVGSSGKPFTDIVQIGIGGSCIGPSLACNALLHLKQEAMRVHFISGCDSHQTQIVLDNLPAKSTLFLLVSKSFMTPETLLNAEQAKEWLNKQYRNNHAWRDHFIVVSSNQKKAKLFGLSEENYCAIPQDIGGRYSIWSAAALSLAICVGRKNFEEFLAGARSMDQHFIERGMENNLPILLGLIGIWYASFFRASSRAILVYDSALRELPAYIQQLEMESNGKSVTQDGLVCNYPTVPIVWGGLGLDGQHSFYQMLHQGTQLVPADFIIAKQALSPIPKNEETVQANFLAQMQALMFGGQGDAGLTNRGNQPSNAIVLSEISPYVLGELLALYEHRTFTQAFVWQINPFDQGGVELGKRIASQLLPNLTQGQSHSKQGLDSSTRNLIKRLRR